jgi:serine/threonine-protein kinase HipA
MSNELAVLIEDRHAGALSRASGGRLTFAYSDDYIVPPRPTPLSVSMPVQIRTHRGRTLVNWLAGLLPDNEAVLRRWAREFHANARSPFSLLGTPVGEDCAGAVRFVHPERLERELARTAEVQWLSDAEVAQRLRDLRDDSTAWLGRTFTGQFSLAGAQAKTALRRERGRWGVPHGAAATTHILKPAVAGLDDHDLNEHLCLTAARRCGLTAASTELARFEDQSAVVVTRYDRRIEGREVKRVHQEDACQALGFPPAEKYQSDGGPGVRQIAELLRRAMPANVAEQAVVAFADALAFNWLIAGTDAHAKNYSLLLAADQVRIAPLYDVASALPYGAHERELRLAMSIGGDYRLVPYKNPWPAAAGELGLDPGYLTSCVGALAQRLPDAFADVAREDGVASLRRSLPNKLARLIAKRGKYCRGVLAESGAAVS